MDFQDIHDFDFDCLEEFEGDFGFSSSTTSSDTISISNDSLSSSETDQPNPKKRKQTERGLHIDGTRKLSRPRIVRSDVRRNYVMRWVNVFNSCDYVTMMDHISQCYDVDVITQQRDLRYGMQCWH